MSPLYTLLVRNQGQVLTPELILGLTHAHAAIDRLATGEPPQPLDGPWAAAPNLRPSSRRLVLDEHERVAAWVAEQANCSVHAWAGYTCLGLEVDASPVWCRPLTRLPSPSTSTSGSSTRPR